MYIAYNRKQLAREVLNEIGAIRTASRFTMRPQYLLDDEHGQYMLHKYGWRGERRIYDVVAHLEIAEDGKIWPHRDGTGLNLAEMLMSRGVPQKEIVMAFYHELRRADTGFAVAWSADLYCSGLGTSTEDLSSSVRTFML